MSEPKYREWILDTIDSLRSRKARPDLERICRMVRRRHGSEPDRTCAELEKLIQEQTVLKVNYKGSISYRNAAKVQRRSRKKDDVTLATAGRRSATEEASHSDLSNGDSAVGPADQDDEDLEADASMAMDTDSNAEEADESRDGQDGHFSAVASVSSTPVHCPPVHCPPERAVSAPCSPSGSRPVPGHGSVLDVVTFQKGGVRPSSLPPSSPRALAHNDWVYDSTVCSVERQHPGMHKDKVITKPGIPSIMSSALKVKREEGSKIQEGGVTLDQLVPDYAARPHQEEPRNVSNGRPQTLPLPTENGITLTKKRDGAVLSVAEESHVNGGSSEDVSVKKETMNPNLLQWTVADVASYFSDAGFPEQAMAFRSQEIDGKSLLLMQRSDVLTGLSIRLGPALKIYERHVKVLQRTHFLEFDDL
ncbi:sterile alpha motif domain containing 1a [Boleophthalmus pectinirostris]|uniref:sterile alpha motif domain containing 1a n=1 Tax=Boleophthalmus pectinirostris TaxID=150288 RepID=UPI000A1C3B45|nr:sterile alpha motif domain containing 1a [Boleophthalmus pectinirostris]